MMKNIKQNTNAGFSLVEVLVGTVVVISATVVVLSIIISSFRISSKTTTSSVIRQNGNYSLSQASRMIQFAESFDGARVNASSALESTCPATDKTYKYLYLTYNGSTKTLYCSDSNGIQINSASSIDVSKVNVGTCNFTCRQNVGEGPIIGINFDLSIGGANEVVEKKAGIIFSTSVKMRNF